MALSATVRLRSAEDFRGPSHVAGLDPEDRSVPASARCDGIDSGDVDMGIGQLGGYIGQGADTVVAPYEKGSLRAHQLDSRPFGRGQKRSLGSVWASRLMDHILRWLADGLIVKLLNACSRRAGPQLTRLKAGPIAYADIEMYRSKEIGKCSA